MGKLPNASAEDMEGFGVALGIEPFVNRDLATGLLVEPLPDRRVYVPRDWYFVSREEKSEHPDVVMFREWMLEQIAADKSMPPPRS